MRTAMSAGQWGDPIYIGCIFVNDYNIWRNNLYWANISSKVVIENWYRMQKCFLIFWVHSFPINMYNLTSISELIEENSEFSWEF
jgi:hypothetical protein